MAAIKGVIADGSTVVFGKTAGGIVCCKHWLPNVVASMVPLYLRMGCGSCSRSFPTLSETPSSAPSYRKRTYTETYGGSAKGMPKNWVTVPSLVPTAVAPSSFTVAKFVVAPATAVAYSKRVSSIVDSRRGYG